MASSFYPPVLAEGEARGEARGRAEGEAKAGRAILLRLLRRRFGPVLPRRLLDAHLSTPVWAPARRSSRPGRSAS